VWGLHPTNKKTKIRVYGECSEVNNINSCSLWLLNVRNENSLTETDTAPDGNGGRPVRPRTETAADRYGPGRERRQTDTAPDGNCGQTDMGSDGLVQKIKRMLFPMQVDFLIQNKSQIIFTASQYRGWEVSA
jgi:hypothetical protein